MSRWRTAASAVSYSAVSPRRAMRCRWSRWAAQRRNRSLHARPRPRCAASGRPIAPIWACRAMDGPAMLFRLAALNSDYAACIDADRLEDWPDFFLDECLYKITTAENLRRGYAAGVIYADSRAMLRDRVAALREANIYERHAYRHIVGMPRLE